jgi:hypothetical protein
MRSSRLPDDHPIIILPQSGRSEYAEALCQLNRPWITYSLKAGEVIDLGIVTTDFRVQGSQPFSVATIHLGGSAVYNGKILDAKGDPLLSLPAAVAQYRTKYLFLAPDDYDRSFVVVGPMDAQVTLDGVAFAMSSPIGQTGYGVRRIELDAKGGGSHVLTSNKPVGIQVMGYGSYTSYQYPGGSDFVSIAPLPVN